jgi:hypothetical protein
LCSPGSCNRHVVLSPYRASISSDCSGISKTLDQSIAHASRESTHPR